MVDYLRPEPEPCDDASRAAIRPKDTTQALVRDVADLARRITGVEPPFILPLFPEALSRAVVDVAPRVFFQRLAAAGGGLCRGVVVRVLCRVLCRILCRVLFDVSLT